jgi:hypothetical protein
MENQEAANELCRMFFRKRSSIWVGDDDWRRDYDKPFSVAGETYYLGRHYFYVKTDGKYTTFRPNKHLLETLRQVLSQRETEQSEAHNARVTASLLRRVS